MSESSPEAERINESVTQAGGESSHEADLAASGADFPDVGDDDVVNESSGAAGGSSHAADVDAGYDDESDSPVLRDGGNQEDGTL